MIFVYRRAASDSARALSRELRGGVRCVGQLRAADRLHREFVPGRDRIVFWGDFLSDFSDDVCLNATEVGNKITDAEILAAAGVNTITISRTQPVVTPAVAPDDGFHSLRRELLESMSEFALIADARQSQPLLDGLTQLHGLLARYREMAAQPAPVAAPAAEWLPRRKAHVGGNDLLTVTQNPDYWVKKETIAKEFRVHSFMGKSIRSGVKIPREGMAQHEWIRSMEGGWKISYDGTSVKQKHRDIAHAAVNALGLDFGAVDVAERPDGSVFVLEVNRAPGIEEGTLTAYARAIEAWAADSVEIAA